MQDSLVLTPPEAKTLTPSDLLQVALSKDAAIDVIERLAKLQVDMRRLDAEVDFNDALVRCQEEIKTVVNDAQGQKKAYATYKALDKEVRPIYLRHGFSISFGAGECSVPNHIVVLADLSRGLHTRPYKLPMDASGLGPKGEGALSRPHAILAAMEYGRRCLLKSIFNIVTGDEETVTNGELMHAIEKMEDAGTLDILMHYYREAYKQFESSPDAIRAIVAAKIKRQKEIKHAAS